MLPDRIVTTDNRRKGNRQEGRSRTSQEIRFILCLGLLGFSMCAQKSLYEILQSGTEAGPEWMYQHSWDLMVGVENGSDRLIEMGAHP